MKIEIPGTFSATVNGKYTATATEATLTVTKIKATITPSYDDMYPEDILNGAANGTTIDFPFTLTITAKASDTAPKAPASYTDISKLSEEELSALVSKIENDPAVYNLIKTINAHFER